MQDQTLILKELLNKVHPLQPEVMEELLAIWTPVKAGRKEMMTVTGSVERYIYVVLDGVQRVYYLDEMDREATIVFTYAPSFGGVLDSFLLQTPSKYNYETLTPSSFLRASFGSFNALMEKHHGIETLVRKGLSGVIAGLEERLVEIQSFSSEEKFRSLLKRSPHILQLVPHKYLASYLGMDATNFSKLINKVRIS
jgi:CRP-like cAMP-binding protein